MRAYHWRSALDLARASGADDEGLSQRARLALRDSGDRAVGLNSHAAAASLYDDALGLWPADDAERPDLLFRVARALFHAYDEGRREQALEEARDALLEVGDRVRAGEAESFLSNVAWERGQGPIVRDHVRRAEELVGDSRSPSSARVLATSARMHVLGDERDEGLRVGHAALEMAEALELDALRAHALTTIGMAKNTLDGTSGLQDMERALAIALEADSPVASSIVNNLAVHAIFNGTLSRSDELYAEAQRLAERYGDGANVRFIRANRIWLDFMLGRWEQSFARANVFIEECESLPHLQEGNVRQTRAAMSWARGDFAASWKDEERALALARQRGETAQLIAALSFTAANKAEEGRYGEARELVAELVPLVRAFGPHGALTRVGVFAEKLGAVESLRAALDHGAGPPAAPWRKAVDATLAGDLRAAADVFAGRGNPTLEAYLRYFAGLQLLDEGRADEGATELEKALAFYRPVAASHYVAAAEARLAGVQSESA